MKKPLVVLVGPPGAGKTTVGMLVAQRLGTTFRDTDDDVEAEAGRSISDIFVDAGEGTFRELERSAVRAALAEHGGVLALGGGAVLDPTTRALLKGHRVVFLDVDLTNLAARVGLAHGRPLLLGNVRAQLRTLMEQRRAYYEEVADTIIDTNAMSADEAAAQIAGLVVGER